MKMKTAFIGISLLAFAFLIIPVEKTQAQDRARIGIKGGVNFSNMKYESKDQTNGTPDANSFTSYHIGLIADLPLVEGISLQPGIMLNSIGSKVEYTGNSWGFTQTVNPVYVEVPVNLLFKPEIGENTKLYVGLGPYIGFGVGGKASVKGNLGGLSGYTDHDLKFGNDSGDDLKSTDIGGNVLAGFEFGNGLILGAQYGMSFTNNAPDSDNNDNKILKNKVLSVSVGYLF